MAQKKGDKNHDADYWIIQCLLDGEKTFGEIKKILADRKIKYTNKGLSKRLQDLIRRHRISKQKLDDSYPRYRVQERVLKEVNLIASVFTLEVLKKMTEKSKLEHHASTEEFIKNLIQQCGFYVLYTFIRGWKYGLQEAPNQKTEFFRIWQENVYPVPFLKPYFDLGLVRTIGKKKETKNYLDHYSYPDERKIFFGKIESMLEKFYPKETQLYDTIIKNLGVTTRNAWEEHFINKYVKDNKK